MYVVWGVCLLLVFVVLCAERVVLVLVYADGDFYFGPALDTNQSRSTPLAVPDYMRVITSCLIVRCLPIPNAIGRSVVHWISPTCFVRSAVSDVPIFLARCW